MAVVVQRGLTTHSRFAQQVLAAGQREVESKLDDIGRDAVKRANDRVAKLYDNARESSRRKRGQKKLLGSFSYEIVRSPGPGLPATIRLKSSANTKKVAALEYGSLAHTISAKNKPFLVFPRAPTSVLGEVVKTTLGPAKGQRQTRRALDLRSKEGLTRTKSVEHPGNREGKFMRLALQGAVRAQFRKVSVNA